MANNLQENLKLAEQVEAAGIDPFDAPIPGESLTSDSENLRPYERPPSYTNVESAMAFIFDQMTEDENYERVVETMRNGIPISDITQVYLTKGFHEGAWSPDLLLLLIEPTMYLLMWLADGVDIDFVLDDEPDEEEQEEAFRSEARAEIARLQPKEDKSVADIKNKVPSSLLGKMEDFKGEA